MVQKIKLGAFLVAAELYELAAYLASIIEAALQKQHSPQRSMNLNLHLEMLNVCAVFCNQPLRVKWQIDYMTRSIKEGVCHALKIVQPQRTKWASTPTCPTNYDL